MDETIGDDLWRQEVAPRASSASSPSWKTWLFTLCCLALIVPAWNVLIDPHEVFGTGLLPRSADPNERFLKVEQLLDEKRNGRTYNALVVGASSAGSFPVSALERRYPGTRFYNLALRSGHFSEIAEAIAFHHRLVFPLQRAVVVLDTFQFVEPPRRGGFTAPHPRISGESRASFWWGQLWSSSFVGGANKVIANLREAPRIEVDWSTGEYHYSGRDLSAIRTAMAKPVVHQPWRDQSLNELRALVDTMDAHDIEWSLVLAPRADGAHKALAQWLATRAPDFYGRMDVLPAEQIDDFADATHVLPDFVARHLDTASDALEACNYHGNSASYAQFLWTKGVRPWDETTSVGDLEKCPVGK